MKQILKLLALVLIVEGVLASEKKKTPTAQTNENVNHEVRREYPENYMNERNATAEQATFRKFVHHRHLQRLNMLRDLKQQTYSKQYKMLESLFPNIFEEIQQQRVLLESSGYIPGGDWPMNMTIRDAMTQVIEGTLFVGEAFLRMPEVTRRMLKSNKEWELTIGWAWTFSSECLVYLDERMHDPIKLMGQELGYVEKDPEFLKKYKEELDELEKADDIKVDVSKFLEETKKKLQDKKKSERGPKMSKASSEL
ncbi:hypothetical protein CHUAL_012869 [Chamberlinius hualienensis]